MYLVMTRSHLRTLPGISMVTVFAAAAVVAGVRGPHPGAGRQGVPIPSQEDALVLKSPLQLNPLTLNLPPQTPLHYLAPLDRQATTCSPKMNHYNGMDLE